jgi:hypothetical protein
LACKPGSVHRVAPVGWPFIWSACCQALRATNPGGGPETAWGLHPVPPLFGFAPSGVCLDRPCYQNRGALLPHLFTLARLRPKASTWRFVSVALSLGLPPPDVIRHLDSVEPGLSSPSDLSALGKSGHPANWRVVAIGAGGGGVNRLLNSGFPTPFVAGL